MRFSPVTIAVTVLFILARPTAAAEPCIDSPRQCSLMASGNHRSIHDSVHLHQPLPRDLANALFERSGKSAHQDPTHINQMENDHPRYYANSIVKSIQHMANAHCGHAKYAGQDCIIQAAGHLHIVDFPSSSHTTPHDSHKSTSFKRRNNPAYNGNSRSRDEAKALFGRSTYHRGTTQHKAYKINASAMLQAEQKNNALQKQINQLRQEQMSVRKTLQGVPGGARRIAQQYTSPETFNPAIMKALGGY